MAAAFTIHIRNQYVTEQVMEEFFSNSIGSPYYGRRDDRNRYPTREQCRLIGDLWKNGYGWSSDEARVANEDACWDANGNFVRDNPLGISWLLEYSFSIMSLTPNLYVGEVSWLKAAHMEDHDTYIPGPIERLSELFDDKGAYGVLITDDLIAEVANAFDIPNITRYAVESASDVVAFLEQHKGERAFTISW